MNDDVCATILSFLPVTEAYRLSMLSKRFLHSWISCSDLSFDSSLYNKLSNEQFINMVRHILERHPGKQVRKFLLKLDPYGHKDLVCSLLREAIPKGIDELELDFSQSGCTMEIPFRRVLVAAKKARIMRFTNCQIYNVSVPCGPKSMPFARKPIYYLRYLREITLNKVLIQSTIVSAIFSGCSSLNSMKLIDCRLSYDMLFPFYIDAEHLKDFRCLVVEGCFLPESISLNAPSLSSFHQTGNNGFIDPNSEMPRLDDVVLNSTIVSGDFGMKLIQSLDHVRVLTLSASALKELCGVETLALSNLNEFHVIHNLTEEVDTHNMIASFVKRCPGIRRYNAVRQNTLETFRVFNSSSQLPSSCSSLSYSSSVSDTDRSNNMKTWGGVEPVFNIYGR